MGIVPTNDGRYIQAAINHDGSTGFREVDPATVEQSLVEDVGKEISKAAIGDLNLHMRRVVRIGLNPTVFMSYA